MKKLQSLNLLMKIVLVSWVIGIFLIILLYTYIIIKDTSFVSELFWPVVFFCIFYFGILINIATRFWGKKISEIAESKYKTHLDFTSLEKKKRLDDFLYMVSDPEIDMLAGMYFLFIKLASLNFVVLFLCILININYT